MEAPDLPPIPDDLVGRLLRARAYVDDHLTEPLSFRALARVAGIEPFLFADLFLIAFGVSVEQHILDRRLAHAQELLRTTDLPLEDVAHAAGFKDAMAMTRPFLRVLRRTPESYRAGNGW